MDNLQRKYRLLEVDERSSIDDIKRSYKRLCLKYHPDKCNGDNEKFIELKEAYEELIKVKETNINFFIFFMNFWSLFSNSNDVKVYITVSIEDIYNRKVKKIGYTRITDKLNKSKETFYLELVGWREEYVLDDLGDYNIISKRYGKLYIYVSVDFTRYEHLELNKIINLYDINTVKHINLYEYYYGVSYILKYFNETNINIERYIPYKEGDVQLFEGYGLTNEDGVSHNLYVVYKVDLTKCDVSEENRCIINQCFNK